MQGSHRFFVDYRYDSCGLFAEGVIPKTAIGVPAAKERFVRLGDIGLGFSEGPKTAHNDFHSSSTAALSCSAFTSM